MNYNVTVERMNKMHGLWVSAVPAVLPPNATLALTGGVLVDSAVEVAFLWNFGDGEQVLRQFKPPYDESFQVPDPTVAQVLVEHNTTHIYNTPGEGWGRCLSSSELGQPTFGYDSPSHSHFDPAWVG